MRSACLVTLFALAACSQSPKPTADVAAIPGVEFIGRYEGLRRSDYSARTYVDFRTDEFYKSDGLMVLSVSLLPRGSDELSGPLGPGLLVFEVPLSWKQYHALFANGGIVNLPSWQMGPTRFQAQARPGKHEDERLVVIQNFGKVSAKSREAKRGQLRMLLRKGRLSSLSLVQEIQDWREMNWVRALDDGGLTFNRTQEGLAVSLDPLAERLKDESEIEKAIAPKRR